MDKLLVANRGEIAVRVLRAAAELGITTVAVYAHEDRASVHRLKADEAYQLGEPGHPVRAYLDVDALVELAMQVGADAIHPGYGFLSESPELARRCGEAGVTFVGPTPETMVLTGDKTRARAAAREAGVPVLAASEHVADVDVAREAARELRFPLFVKAAAGGGGRGMRFVSEAGELAEAVETAQREAAGAFGRGEVFLEEAVIRPRHVEVQILGDATGEVIHCFERDCSVQRRHQKVVEIAPAPRLGAETRQRLLDDAVAFGRQVGYQNAGTVEFLVDQDGGHAFIEMNPRIQVEHTVTEEVTGIDLVRAQLRLADGETLADIGLAQDVIEVRGTAIQCRVTTEDPRNGFRPDLGRLSAVRETGGAGVRVDAASIEAGTEIMPYFDSLLVKITARGPDLADAAARAQRAVSEFRVRGVHTNQGFLLGVLGDPDFVAGGVTTAFIEERPHLLSGSVGRDRTSRLLDYLAEVTVNRHEELARPAVAPAAKLPAIPSDTPPDGSRQRLLELGPEGFAANLRARERVEVTDTTFRDAHQSLLATRMRSHDLLTAAPALAARLPELLSIELWGGATFDTMVRFLWEDPWQRLTQLREAIPNVCFQMLLRGANAVGYGSYPDEVVRAFVAEAAEAGIDLFRVFDALNNADRMAGAIAAVRETDRIAEATICYTGGVHDPAEPTYTLDYYLSVAEQLVEAGPHVLAIKDMAGLLTPSAAHTLVSALRERFDAPVHLHTHDTAGGQLATLLAASEAGVDAVDTAAAPLAGSTSQPSMSALVAATAAGARTTGLDLDAVIGLEPYWEKVRAQYATYDIGPPAPTGRVYRHQMPGGQLSNLRQQAAGLGLGERFDEIEELYRRCDELLGRLIKVTPTSKVVADLALYLASAGVEPDELAADPTRYGLPASVYDFLAGDLGVPPGGWPEPLRTRALEGREAPESGAAADDGAVAAASPGGERRDALTCTLFPKPAADLDDARERYGDLSVLPTWLFFHGLPEGEEVVVDLERGVRLFIELEAITDADEHGRRTVVMRVNGQTRYADAIDRAVGTPPAAVERADPAQGGHVAAPLTGVVSITVAEGEPVEVAAQLGVIEAMKMETAISAPVAGTVSRIVAPSGTSVEPGDLIIEIAS